MASTAYDALSSRLDDIDQLMAAHGAVGGVERGRRFEVEALNRAAVLLLSAHLEGYLEDLLSEAVSAVHTGLATDDLTKRFANPTTGNVDGLFRFLGLNKPCDSISWQRAGNAAVKKNINELVETRNAIAHGTTGVTVHKRMVTRYRQYVVGFAKRFDNLVRDRVATLTGTSPWSDA